MAVCSIGNTNLDAVTTFTYLGRTLSNTADDRKAVEDRISIGWGAFRKVESIISNRHVSMTTKRKTYETFVSPCILYACETITWKSESIKKMQTFQNHIMRWMTGKCQIDRTPINKLFELTKLFPIEQTIRTRKLKWFGHIKRSELPIRATFEGNIEGKRLRGRPRRRWRDDVTEWTRMSWKEINVAVQDRSRWRAIAET